MKIYKLEYAYDEFMDGRMAEGVHLFSTLDNAFRFCELHYEKKKEEFTEENDYFYCGSNGEWHSETWYISEVVLDQDLDLYKAR